MKSILALALLALAACAQPSAPPPPAAAPLPSAEVTEAPMMLASGVELQFHRRATDAALPKPGPETSVLVHYEGSLVSDGSVFDSSFERGEPVEFPLNRVVRGFSEAIQQMRPGDDLVATFPGEMGYGARGNPPAIPPDAALRFRIVLISFIAADGSTIGGE